MNLNFKPMITIAAILFAGIALAQEGGMRIGRETNLPIPRYVSLNASESNMRRGPDLDYQIDWVYHVRGLPVRVIGESGHWRKVEDFEGYNGWLHYALLSGNRTVLVLAEKASVNKEASQNSSLVAILEKNVVANLKACTLDWCEIEKDGYDGWIQKTNIWGVDAEEVFE